MVTNPYTNVMNINKYWILYNIGILIKYYISIIEIILIAYRLPIACLFAFAYAHAMGRARAPPPMCWALRGPPGPSDGGPASPAQGGGAWARHIACA